MYKSNYDKYPKIEIDSEGFTVSEGWKEITGNIKNAAAKQGKKRTVITFETYPGTNDREVLGMLQTGLSPELVIDISDLFYGEEKINRICHADVTDDRIFGYMTRLTITDFIDHERIYPALKEIEGVSKGIILIYGCGASEILKHVRRSNDSTSESADAGNESVHIAKVPGDDYYLFMYADLARWEIQQRMRRNEVANLGTTNYDLEISRKYKRAFFVDWRVADRIKRNTAGQWDYVIDTNKPGAPVMIHSDLFRQALHTTANRPFRLVPFFDPGPWGGQWIRKICAPEKEEVNYAWCFDCVPEENSLRFDFDGVIFESPAINLVFFQPEALLGERVYARFGAEFPIRFDFLDTMEGDNLSLQVHPDTGYIRETFGMSYTQDESYYLLDAGENSRVYLGLKDDIDAGRMMEELRHAEEGGPGFDADKHIASWPAKKHDHFLIPAGTVHCSGKNCMVLEISATPFIFTFKLWDWGRLGLDGMPRPINIEHGKNVIRWERTESWVKKELVNQITPVSETSGIKEERTGMHEFEFIDTIRHWFSEKVFHNCNGSVNVLNLVEGREAIIESPDATFAPFIVHYAETFVIPAGVGRYSIRPYGESEGRQCATIKAYIRK